MSKMRRAMPRGAESHDDADPAPGRRFETFFRAACVYVRERSETSEARVADLIGLKVSVSIDRFESGETFPTKNFERYAAAYAYDAEMDPRDLIAMAVDWWKHHGRPPLTKKQERQQAAVGSEPTAAEVLEAIRRAEEQGRDGASTEPISTRKKRAGGE